MVAECLGGEGCGVVASLRKQQDEEPTMMGALCGMYVEGQRVDWEAVFGSGARRFR